jgi:hypothetical protein
LRGYWAKGQGAVDLTASSGWCAPSEAAMDLWDPLRTRNWPVGLTEDDLAWLAKMLWLGELDPEPYTLAEIPRFSVQRGGLRFPVRGDDGTS